MVSTLWLLVVIVRTIQAQRKRSSPRALVVPESVSSDPIADPVPRFSPAVMPRLGWKLAK